MLRAVWQKLTTSIEMSTYSLATPGYTVDLYLESLFKSYHLIIHTASRGRLAQWESVRFVNISSEGTVVRYSPQDNFSIANLFRNKGLTEIQYVDERHSRNLDLGMLWRQSHCVKGNVALKIGPDVI